MSLIQVSERDPYFSRAEVSNSDLSWLEKYWLPNEQVGDIEKAYRFGTLLDAIITEKHKVNFFKLTVAGEKYSKEEFDLAEEMAKWFWRDPFCKHLATHSEMQKVSTRRGFEIKHECFVFTMDVRCKWDLFAKPKLAMTGDIKSTTATTQKQFVEACEYFKYFRQRAWYMDIENVNKDMLIGVSKVNKKIFKVPVIRGGEFYNRGKQQYQELAWKHHYLFGDVEQTIFIGTPQLQTA